MKSEHTILVILAVVLVSTLLIQSLTPTITGHAIDENNSTTDNEEITEDKEISTSIVSYPDDEITLTMDSTKFAQNSPIEGTLKITVSEELLPSQKLTFTIGTDSFTFGIDEVLKLHNYNMEYDNIEYLAQNAEITKDLTFSSGGSKLIGLQVPRHSDMEVVDFSISGSIYLDSYANSVAIDLGNEGTSDWYYQGVKQDFTGNVLSSPDLDGVAEGSGYIQNDIDGDSYYYCELINLPAGKDYQISADYEKLGENGDIKATILSSKVADQWTGGADNCNLPESGNDRSCDISLDYTIEGEYLICIYSDDSNAIPEELLYSFPLDTSESTSTSKTCPTSTGSICDKTGFANYFIYIEGSTYDQNLISTETISNWETFSDSILTGAKYYVGSGDQYTGICKSEICNIPINITSSSAGIVTLKDLSMIYKYNSVTQSSSSFYDLIESEANITAIESEVLDEGATFTIDISLLDIKLSELGSYNISASFMGLESSSNFNILDPSDIYDAASLITTTLDKYESYSDETNDEYWIIKMLDRDQYITNTIETLKSYKTQIGFVDEDTLYANTEKLISGEPWKISFSQTFSDTLIIEPSDIPSQAGDETAVYFMQDKVSVTGTSRLVSIQTFDGETSDYTFIKKTIKANEAIDNALLYEVAPISFNKLLYTSRPTTSSGEVGEFSLSLNSGSTKDYYYLSGDTLNIYDFSTVIVVADEEIEIEPECTSDLDCSSGYICVSQECEPDFSCGDDICTKPFEDETSCAVDCTESSYLLIIIPLIILLAAGVLGYIFKDQILEKFGKKSSVDQITNPATATKVKVLSPLGNFAKKAISKGVREKSIIEALKKKGYEEDKIKAAISEAKSN